MKFTFQIQQEQQQPSGPFKHMVSYMAGKDCPKQFRILPAFAPAVNGTVDPMSWVPFEADGVNTPWLLGYQIWSNVGHGPWGRGGNRKSFLRFDTVFEDYKFDAIQRVVDVARNYPEWRYLFEKVAQPGGKQDSVLRWFPATEILANVVILTATGMPKTTVGSFSAALTRQLCGGIAQGGEAEEGIINRLSNLPEEIIAQNPYLRYWLGDITDPNNGVVLEIYRDESRNPAPYRIRPARDGGSGILHMSVTKEQMADRVDFSNPHNMMEPPEPQAEVDRLASCLNEWSPDHKYHEFELLKLAFPEFEVPNPPPRGSVNGFVPPVATETTTTQTQRVTYPPPVALPQPKQVSQNANVIYPANYGTPAQQGQPMVMQSGAEATWPGPKPTVTAGQPQYPATQPSTFNKIVGQIPANEEPPAVQPVPPNQVSNIPGQDVPKFNGAAFLERLKSGN